MTAPSRHRSRVPRAQRFNVSIANRQRRRSVDRRRLGRIVNGALAELARSGPADLGISLVAAPEMTRLNESFVRHRGPTDVITFDYTDSGVRPGRGAKRLKHPNPGTRTVIEGEIVVCVDEAILQARRFRTTWRLELVRYVIHGILHLLGHDDTTAVARRKMKIEEDRLLREMARRFPLSKL
jgi:probable rRNA maturation factor